MKDGATIVDSILCNGAQVHEKAIVQKGCIVSFNVCKLISNNIFILNFGKASIGRDFILAPFSKITAHTPEVQEDDEIEPEVVIEELDLGVNGNGKLWVAKTELTNTIGTLHTPPL